MLTPNPLSRVVAWLNREGMRFELIGETVRVRSQRWHVDFSYDATLDQLV